MEGIKKNTDMNTFEKLTDNFIKTFWKPNNDTLQEYLKKIDSYKKLVDKTPNRFLQYHLDDQVKKEHYEIAQYIKETADKRGFTLQ